jgi:hypothetical protein
VRSVKIGKHVISLWLMAVMLVSAVGSGALGYYIWTRLTIPLEIKEPLEILDYPSQLSLYPGENKSFQISLVNHASVNYSVILDFSLDNTTYQDNYVTFSNEIYRVTPGQQNLTAWLVVESYAPPTNVTLTIDCKRGIYPSGLVGYWRFDEGSGTIAFDISGNNKNGTLVNGPLWIDGKYGKALKFDGIDDYVVIPDLYNSSPSSLTVSAWINLSLFAGGPIIHHCRNGEFTMENPMSEVVGFGVKLTNNEWYVIRGTATANAWHCVTGTWIKGNSIKLYVDGILINQTSVPDYYLFDASWEAAAIGSRYGWHEFFNGAIDDVRVYERALSAEEIKASSLGLLP